MIQMSKVVSVVVAVLMLGGCAQRLVGYAEQLDARAEHEVDTILQFALTRFCRLPIDVMMRTMVEHPWTIQAWAACPEIRAFDAMLDTAPPVE